MSHSEQPCSFDEFPASLYGTKQDLSGVTLLAFVEYGWWTVRAVVCKRCVVSLGQMKNLLLLSDGPIEDGNKELYTVCCSTVEITFCFYVCSRSIVRSVKKSVC